MVSSPVNEVEALIRITRPLYAEEDLGLELDNTVYTLDVSTIDMCLSVFPRVLFRTTKSAVKLHTLLDLRGNIPTFIHISNGKLHDFIFNTSWPARRGRPATQ